MAFLRDELPYLSVIHLSLYYGGNMTQGKLLELLEDLGISISAGYLSSLLIKNLSDWETELNEVYREGLASSPWQDLDQTGARVGGVNYTTNIICNPVYTVYQTTRNKDRLSVLRILQNTQELEFILNEFTYELLGQLKLPLKWQKQLKLLPQETVLTQTQFHALLEQHRSQLSTGYRRRIQEAAAIAFYHQQNNWPVVRTLVCDDARQFKLLTEELALCWVHEGRHYKKLNPLVAYHQKLLDQFLTEFWDYYRELLTYKEAPSAQAAEELRAEFYRLFNSDSGYQQLDERKRLTATKISNGLNLFSLKEIPCDNQIRNLLDPIPASKIFVPFQRVYQWLNKQGVMKKFLYLDREILIALDGTEYFSSKKINCPHCNHRNHRNGTTTYFHSCVTPIVVSTNRKQVINKDARIY